MKKTIFWGLVAVSLLIIVVSFGFQKAYEVLGLEGKSGIKVTSSPAAKVYLDGSDAGATPYENENLKVGEYELKLVSDSGDWQGKVSLNKGVITVVNRELSSNIASASGEVLTLAEGSGITIITDPDGAEVEIDGKNYGKTPLKVTDVKPGEHTFIIGHDNYLKRSIQAKLPDNLYLNLRVDLAISEMVFPQVAAPDISKEQKLYVEQTPTGFLRVREGPSVSFKEVTKVSSGDTLTLIEDLNSWLKVRLDTGEEGYVSSNYIQKSS